VWWPFGNTLEGPYQRAMAKMDRNNSPVTALNGGVIPCHTWGIIMDPAKLPVLPDLPDLPATGLPEEERRKETKLIKIAAFDSCLVGLTNKGHVLKIDGLANEELVQTSRYVSESSRMMWHPFLNCDAQLPKPVRAWSYVSESSRTM